MGAGTLGGRFDRALCRGPAAQFAMTVVGATALAAVVPGGPPDPGVDRHWVVLVGALLAGAGLLTLRRRPVIALGVCLVVCTGAQLLVGGPTGLVVLVLLALVSVALRRPLRVVVSLLVVSCCVYLTGDLLTGGFDSRVLAPLALMVAVTAAGVAVAGQRALVRAATERVVTAERTREDEAARRVAEERLRIARELHDVVAHHVAVMGVQAGAADQLMTSDQEQARAALAQVRTSGRTALAELGAVVGLLRTPAQVRAEDHAGDRDELGAAAAVPLGLDRLPELVARVQAAGLQVSVLGEPAAAAAARLDEVATIAAYRIVQESLTNAMRHGSGGAQLSLACTPGTVTVTVTNPLPGRTAATDRQGTGHGLLGMRERAALVGADFWAGAGDGVFEVRASIPVRGGAEA